MLESVVDFIEVGFTLSLFINAALFFPQVIRMINKKTSEGVSFITFFGFLLIQLWTTLHGFLKKDYLLAYGTILSMITCGWVTILIIRYRPKKVKK